MENRQSDAPPIGETEGKSEQVERMFDEIAPRYDLLNRVLSLGIDRWWRLRAIRMLRGEHPRRILDVATGTADLAIAAARHLNPAGVVGIDLAERMLERGREKVRERDLDDRIALGQADAAELPFKDDAFDAALVGFGVRNFEDLRGGLSETARVLRPGGKLVVGGLLSPSRAAYEYLPASVEAFPDGADFLACMEAAGFTETEWQPLTFGIASLYAGRVAG
ncbi:MAG: bifunctional demethylmenaquinone methyltransferase/2-methoxy-6-polyprenyl-1,4-benzoquinol methylase [Bacteroidetes bacterium QS_8_64_10]|nr:MAG: bifunctional demethylmenaquinone methyltransferase/2-methoxy-6-polyprenyl-1,4-benzoquinol methylase [Bacteroidetes bacterium QS_8_64_10]